MHTYKKNTQKVFLVGTVSDVLNQKGTTFLSGDSKKPYNQWLYKVVDFEIPLNTKHNLALSCMLQEINEFKADCRMFGSKLPKIGDKVLIRIISNYRGPTKVDVEKARIVEVIKN